MIKLGDTVYIDGEIKSATEKDVEFFNELERIANESKSQEVTIDDRIASLETTTDDMILLMAELIGGN